MRIRRFIFLLILGAIGIGPAYPAVCFDTWSNAVGTVGELKNNGEFDPGKLKLEDDTLLLNTGGRPLATGSDPIEGDDFPFCDGDPCTSSRSDAVMLPIEVPTAPPDVIVDVPKGEDLELKQKKKNDPPPSLDLPNSRYDFDKLSLNDASTLTSSGAGDLTINVSDKLEIKGSSSFSIDRTGAVTINVDGDLKITEASLLSITGASSVTINVSGNLEIKDGGALRIEQAGAVAINVGGELKVDQSSALTIDQTESVAVAVHKDLKIENSSTLTISESGAVGISVGDNQKINKGSTLSISGAEPVTLDVSGKLEILDDSRLDLHDAGQVIVQVGEDLTVKESQVNATGDALDLILLVGDDVKIEGQNKDGEPADQFNAIVYAAGKLEVKGGVEIEGALVGGKEAVIKKDGDRSPVITYVDTTDLVIDGLCGPVPPPTIDHLRLLHDGSGIVGVPESVTIQACVDADCTDLYAGSVTVALQPGDATSSWSGSGVAADEVTFTGGSHAVALTHTAAGVVTIGLTATPTPSNGVRCYVGAVEDCTITFVAPTFALILPDQVSGDTSVGTLTLSDCWPDFQSQTIAITVATQYLSPATVGPAVRVNGTVLPTDGTGAAVGFDFDGGCSAPVRVDYADAGRIGLDIDFVGTGALGALSISGSQSLVFYPAALVVEAEDLSGTPLNAAAAGASPIETAGAPFRLRITAVNSGGAPTAAYQPQAADRLLVYARRTGPDPGAEGVLDVSTGTSVSTQGGPPAGPADYQLSGIAPGDLTDGVFDYPAARYSEVGLISLYALDSDYMGHPIAAAPTPVGRFVPSRFLVSGGVTNRFSTVGCSGDNFSYLDEPLRATVTLTAVNALNDVTANYRDGFASVDGTGFGAFGSGSPNTLGIRSMADLSDRLTVRGVSSGGWVAGVLDLDFDLELGRATLPDGPHDASVIGVAHGGDDDGIGLQAPDTDIDGVGGDEHVRVADVNLRYGRLAVGSAHGSERRDLAIPVAMQVYGGAGVGFVTHSDDDCTLIQAIALSDAAGGGSLPAATCVIDGTGASGSFACVSGTPGIQYDGEADSGAYVVSLKAPGADDTGAIHVTAQTRADADWRFDQDWARFDWTGAGLTDPRGLATFGIYNRASGVIYQRELR